MKLNDYLDKYQGKLNILEESFIRNVFFKDYGEEGLNIITPQVKISREDGSGRTFDIDFVVNSGSKKYAIETHGFHAHDESGIYVRNKKDRFNELQRKNNLIRDRFDKYLELSKEQIDSVDEAIFELRRCFKSDRKLYDLYLGRNSNKITPSPVQKKALENIKQDRSNGHKSGLVILATGLGKTFLSGFDIQNSKSKKILFVAHVEEILRKTKNDFEDLMVDRINEMEMLSKESDTNKKNIFFATIQSLHKTKNLERFSKDFFDYIVIDEAHHAAAPTYQRVLNYFNPRFLLGLTATPFRSDEKEILTSFDNHVFYQMDQEQAVSEGYLADINYIGYFDDIDYSNIRWNGNRYDIDDLNKKLMIESRDQSILKKYRDESVKNEKTIGFCTSIEHADYMANVFNKNGIRSVAIHSKSETSRSRFSNEERETLLKKFREDKFEVAFTVNMFNEGVDIPDVSTILMLRPTDSLTIFIQQIGRGLRLSDGKESLKVLDFIGNYRTRDIILEGLNISPGDFEYDREKDIYYYDNKGKHVIFEKQVINVFKAIVSKKSKEVDYKEIEERWIDYGDFLNQSTLTDAERSNSVTDYWQVDKKKKDINAHIWAIEFYLNNIDNFKTLKELDVALKNNAKENGIIIEGTRALFFSKLLGLIDTESPFNGTSAYYKIKDNPEELNDVISSQMEKLFFWNDIHSPINRHATKSTKTNKESKFTIYTIIFIYQIIIGLHNLGEKSYLSKFELEYFIFFARSHDHVNDVIENIIKFRHSKNIYELEKFLKISTSSKKENNKFNIFDTRYFSILKNVVHFSWSPQKISVELSSIDDLSTKVSKFKDISESYDVFANSDYGEYRKMLYSSKSFFDYYLK